MSIFSSIGRALLNPATLMQLAMGPAGWASLAMRTIGMAVAQQVIQQLGQKLGLPEGIINMAQSAFSAAMGQPGAGVQTVAQAVASFAEQSGISPMQQGQLQRAGRDAENNISQLVDNMIRQMKDDGRKAEARKDEFEGLGTTNGKRGFLFKIAEALGKAIDDQMNNMERLADKIKTQTADNQTYINGMSEKGTAKESSQASLNSQKLGSLNSELQAASQQMGILSQVVSSVLKSVGEAQSTVARKG